MQQAKKVLGFVAFFLAQFFRQRIVAKFGGTSMATAESIRKVTRIIRGDPRIMTVVVSAPGKVNGGDKITDLLLACFALRQQGESFDQPWQLIASRFQHIVSELGLSVAIDVHLREIRTQIERGVSRAYVASRGEYLSSLLLADFLGWQWIDAASVMRFRDDGSLDEVASCRFVHEHCLNRRVVLGGFYGATSCGDIAVFDRGGSDITGSYLAAFLGAAVYRNYTDVTGVYSGDPNGLEPVTHFSHMTATDFLLLHERTGATVVHPVAVEIAVCYCVPVQVCSTFDPGGNFTTIVPA